MSNRDVVVATGIATFFFGFGAGAILAIYLRARSSPMVADLRSSIDYKSAIIGDGLILPVVNMVIVDFLQLHRGSPGTFELVTAIIIGCAVTAYFHVTQAMSGLVNWTMPTPWHWNSLGVWHAVYMLAVATLLALFYVVVLVTVKDGGGLPIEFATVTVGVVIFLALLRLDYVTVNLRALIPGLRG